MKKDAATGFLVGTVMCSPSQFELVRHVARITGPAEWHASDTMEYPIKVSADYYERYIKPNPEYYCKLKKERPK